jgi:glycerol-3-phosphate dehydrogenase (NAD(P)+)
MRVGLVGLGNIGTAVANLVATNGYPVVGWEYHDQVVAEINNDHTNSQFLPGVELSPNLTATTQVAQVLQQSEVLFIALPARFIEQTLTPARDRLHDQAILVNLAKGFEQETGRTPLRILEGMFPQHRRVMLAGPIIANEFVRGMPTIAMLAGQNTSDLLTVARLVETDAFRTRFTNDDLGVELGGILKNVYTIGLGMFDGLQISSMNFRAAYLTTTLREITHMGVSLGGQAETFAYLAGMGDLLATALSEHSHNRKMGELLAQGKTLDQVEAEMGVLPEGYNSLRFVLALAEKLQISLALARGLWEVIHGQIDMDRFITSAVHDFMGQGVRKAE